MTIRTHLVDPGDEPTFRQAYDCFTDGYNADRVDPIIESYDSFRQAFAERPDERDEAVLAYDGERPVGVGVMQFRQLDNTNVAMFLVLVRGAERGRGVGPALFDAVAERCRVNGRTVMLTEVRSRPEAVGSLPGQAFARARGFSLANTDVVRRLDLPVPEETLDALERKASEAGQAYRIVTWSGACPEEYVEAYARLRSEFIDEIPLGEVELEAESWDADRVRDDDARALEAGTTSYVAVAVAPDGRLVAHTRCTVHREHGGLAPQIDTLVQSAHRGHRLGLAVKVANLCALQRDHPDVRRIETSNAEQNAAMIHVNEQLGFRRVEIAQLWQGPVPAA